MTRSDYAWVNFDEDFNENNPSATRTFTVDGNPTETAFLLIQTHDVEAGTHRILINNRELPSFDLVPGGLSDKWTLWMDRIPPGYLTHGSNRVAIHWTGSDSFRVANLAVHWRESD